MKDALQFSDARLGSGFGTLASVVLSPGGTAAYAAVIGNTNLIYPIDLTTDTVGSPLDLSGSVIGTISRRMAITPDGRMLLVLGFNTVSFIDLATFTIEGTVAVGQDAHWIVVTPDGSTAYVSNAQSSTVSVLDLAARTVVATIPVDADPEGIAIGAPASAQPIPTPTPSATSSPTPTPTPSPTPPPSPSPSPSAGLTNYLALGDSFSSGDGAPGYSEAPVDLGCRRSLLDSFPVQLARQAPLQLKGPVVQACTGATTDGTVLTTGKQTTPWVFDKSVENQLAQLSPTYLRTVRLVTLTVGGDDINSVGVVVNCLKDSLDGLDTATARCVGQDTSSLDRLGSKLRALYTAVRQKVAPDARILVLGYPQIFPDARPLTSGPCLIDGAPPVPLKITDVAMRWLNGQERRLNAIVRNSVAGAGAGAEYVDLTNVLSGHQLCSRGSVAWVNGITKELLLSCWLASLSGKECDYSGEPHTPLHPNSAGYAQMAGAIARYLTQHSRPVAQHATADQPPSPSFTVTFDSSRTTRVHLDGGASQPGAARDPITAYLWDFGDTTEKQGVRVTTTYAPPSQPPTSSRVFYVVLVVEDRTGTVGAACRAVFIDASPPSSVPCGLIGG